ncbi:MAG: PIG-L family deacetylase [Bifidobacteriaceae bacterium]|jgi:LmbE family N-acetylglucosaminyl deacetylase|nr:PIG-L family deacetylase [Bifidobacteriaceae bacterium]
MKRALAVMAHPDDVDFWAAGTVALWVREGWAVTYLVVTKGDAGGFEPDAARQDMPGRRRREQERAAATLGVHDVRFLEGFHDGEVTVGADLVRGIVQGIREVRPDLVLAQSPSRTWDDIRLSHPDHLAVGEATARAVYPFARNPFAFPELAASGLGAFEVRELWLQGDPAPDHAVDVTAVWPEREAALLAHASQHPDPPAAAERSRREAATVAARFGLPAGRLAESFKRVLIPN